MNDAQTQSASDARVKFYRVVMYVGLFVLAAPLVFIGYVFSVDASTEFFNFVKKNYACFFGVPLAAFFSFYLVVALEATRGDIEVEFASFKFKGASGPLVFWLLIFLATTGAMKLFWAGA